MKDKINRWKSLGYTDMDFEGEVDEMDVFLFDELCNADTETHSSILDDEDDEDDDMDGFDDTDNFDLDDSDDFD